MRGLAGRLLYTRMNGTQSKSEIGKQEIQNGDPEEILDWQHDGGEEGHYCNQRYFL
jgi:hypothetical protein